MGQIDIHTSIGQLAAADPGRTRLFEQLGLDYCCAGKRSLDEACRAAGINVADVLGQLEPMPEGDGEDPAMLGLSLLADHIEERHHVYLREALPRLGQMIDMVANVHGDIYPWLADLKQVFCGLRAELEMHMLKEERILFPLVRELETAAELPEFHCGSVAHPIAAMEHEHDSAGRALRCLRRISGDFALPPGTCHTFRGLMVGLAELEDDMHQHIHKENNILFARAGEVEQRLRTTPGPLD